MTKYLFRVDDVAEEMSNWDNFEKLCKVFIKYNVKPIIAVIPDNQDPEIKGEKREDWIDLIKDFTIAQHGYQHTFKYKKIHYSFQYDWIKEGKKILEKKFKRNINIYVPPWHSYNLDTMKVLKRLGFDIISDSLGINPHIGYYGIFLVPVSDWRISKKLFGIRTLTMHVQDITKKKIKTIEKFIQKNQHNIISIYEVPGFHPGRFILDFFYIPYFLFRYSHYSPFYQLAKWFKK